PAQLRGKMNMETLSIEPGVKQPELGAEDEKKEEELRSTEPGAEEGKLGAGSSS
ncbi:hypothetical protein A2U01_0056267, partial [Trifolium medium]|nr:hypothetical protein [Trifolium medium]